MITRQLAQTIAAQSIPGMTLWNRLEGQPRTADFDRALRAEVRDALWFVTRQWQAGEFRGEDAASPIGVRVQVEHAPLRGLRPADGAIESLVDNVPLEARVQALPVPFTSGGVEASLDLRLLLGRYWLKLVAGLDPELGPDLVDGYRTAYPVRRPDPATAADATICAHAASWARFDAAAGRLMDGAALYGHLRQGGAAADRVAAAAGREVRLATLGRRFAGWADRLVRQPGAANAWVPDRLEYQFSAVTAEPTAPALVAEEHTGGHLDWYSVDADPAAPTQLPQEPEPVTTRTVSMLPTSVTFPGMPHSRWWTFEDGRTNFANVRPDTTDLATLLLVEFGLVYANDWFLVPLTVPAGGVSRVRDITVTDVFGDRTTILPAGRSAGAPPWGMYGTTLAGADGQLADIGLVTLPTAPHVLTGPPLEEVAIVRDEVANLVWAIEKVVPAPEGPGVDGAQAGYETRALHERLLASRVGEPSGEGGYRVMTSVPEHWIPLVATHRPDDTRQVQLQRAAMPRTFDGDPDAPVPVRPRTWLLRPGLDEAPARPYFLHEEEVPRAGVRLTRAFRRTRTRDGRVWVWLAAQKETGRGEASSGLAFDQLVEPDPAT